ncbi:nucleolar and coiled-body phosphoprotein 1-like [Rhopilema esculentum]|uniref:nucleolar and coiled-body phosphoprotein 1-like n=1 Tax=Rhopilema esculentum TaxID=499914 RepID=UPI0031E0EFC1
MPNMGDNHGQTSAFRQVEDWLRSMGLICYAQPFYDNGYENLEICRQITEEDLNVIGISNVKDKNDILAGVCRLKQKAVYFELEPEKEEAEAVVFRKLDPFVLKMRVKSEMEKSNIQLTEPPYFYPDGSLGSLESLAEQLSYKLETFVEDVLNALDQFRRKQLPAGLYNDVNEMMDMQRQQEQKKKINIKTISPPKPKREIREEPKDYLNVETPFKRTSSLSVHDKRITKSTTNLADMDLDRKPVGASKKDKKSKQVSKSYSTREKSKNLLGLNVRKKSTGSDKKGQKNRESFVAKDLTFNQQQLIELQTKVKHGEISQAYVVAQATENYRQSILGEPSHMKGIDKHQLTKKEKKKLEKEEKKRKKIERGRPSGHSMFYTTDRSDSNADGRSTTPLLDQDESQFDDIVSLGHSSGSDISRESPDLRSFGDKKLHKADNGHAGFLGDGSPNTSAGNINIDRWSSERRSTGSKSRSNSVRSLSKPAKNPPPVPISKDQESSFQNQDSRPEDSALQGSPAGKRSLKPTLSAPSPSKMAIGQRKFSPTHSNHSDTSSEQVSFQNKLKASSFDSMSKGNNGDNVFQVKSFPFAAQDLQEIKLKSNEIKRRSMCPTNNRNNDSLNNEQSEVTDERLNPPLASATAPPKPPDRANAPNDVKPIPSQKPEEVTVPVKNDGFNANVEVKPKGETEKKLPVPPPRRIPNTTATKDTESKDTVTHGDQKPVIPPRKRRSISLEPTNANEATPTVPLAGKKADSIPGASKPTTKPKPVFPPRQLREIKEPDKEHTIQGLHQTEETKIKTEVKPTQVETKDAYIDVDTRKQGPTLRLRSLEELIQMKLDKEDIEISEFPYTNQHGGWSVPFPLVARYSAELEKPLEPVIKSMDTVRCEHLQQKGRATKRAVLMEVLQTSDFDAITTSVEAWLISIGLPMFSKDFKECGVLSFEGLHDLAREDVLGMGIFDIRHVNELMKRLSGDK